MDITLNAVGVRIIADCVVNVDTSSVRKIKYVKSDADQTSGEWDASLGTVDVTVDGEVIEANTYIYYDTVTDDIDVLGAWKIQGYVELSGGLKVHGMDNEGIYSWSTLNVKETL